MQKNSASKAIRCSYLFLLFVFQTILLVKFLNTSLCGCETLTSCEEWVAVAACIDTHFVTFDRASCFEFIAARRADNFNSMEIWMNSFFHTLYPPSALNILCVQSKCFIIIAFLFSNARINISFHPPLRTSPAFSPSHFSGCPPQTAPSGRLRGQFL